MISSKKLLKFLFPTLTVFILLSSCDSNEDKKGRFLLKGNNKMMENDFDGAIDFYSEALALDQEFVDAYYNRGIAYTKTSDFQRAISDFNKAISIDHQYVDAYYHRGIAHFDNGANYNALSDADQLIALAPDDYRGYFLRGLVQETLGNYETALQAFDQAIEHDQTITDLYVNKATIQYYRKDYKSATTNLNKAESLNPEEPNIFNLRSLIAFERDAIDSALKWVDRKSVV